MKLNTACSPFLECNPIINTREAVVMNDNEIDLENTDKIISFLKEKYAKDGIHGVVEWVEETFQPNTRLKMARNMANLSVVDNRVIYDRAILQIDGEGNETDVCYLAPANKDAYSADLFLSIRLNFIEEPFELLLYVIP